MPVFYDRYINLYMMRYDSQVMVRYIKLQGSLRRVRKIAFLN